MAGVSYEGVELRKLPPRFRLQLSQILDVDNSWKKLMASIPSERQRDEPKYKTEHIDLVERHSLTSRKLPAEILLDEWATSGRVRPTVETLYKLLQGCQLYRAADYVATEILSSPIPQRPIDGPARLVPLPVDSNLNVATEETKNSRVSTLLLQDSSINTLIQQLDNYDYAAGNPVHFDLEILEKLTNNFQNPIGSGAFGTVFAMDITPRGPKLAVKLLHPTSTLIEDQFVTEIRVLSEFRHENIVSLVGFCTNGPRFCLVYEFMSGGTLLEAIDSEAPKRLFWPMRLEILLGIIKGIHYLHTAKEKPLIHRDIKSTNILLESYGSDRIRAKIGDFGLAKSLTSSSQTSALASTIFGTSLYMAPEAFRGDISPKMDVFSYGVIILEVITGLPPFDENREEGKDLVTYLEEKVEDDDISPWVDERAGNVDPSVPDRIYKLATHCLEDKRRRPNSDQVVYDVETISSSCIPSTRIQNLL